ncbi:TIR domain-containing protein [Segetibacter aerophilus]|uniref:Uncharacterized protein n=1 Tax=Segetibacter aerophilus TaxID=670293 RepID=A0A512BI51_9BACT|nr:TIR domain-containing protein [Segetibacter aerophilus]GEO11545.1 hypothetical protein SAE01_40410 [Segetibacter aerophilus]
MPKKFGVFISYDHQDAKYIEPIIQLISAMRKDLVFQDKLSLQAGKKWEPQLLKALDEAKIIYCLLV